MRSTPNGPAGILEDSGKAQRRLRGRDFSRKLDCWMQRWNLLCRAVFQRLPCLGRLGEGFGITDRFRGSHTSFLNSHT